MLKFNIWWQGITNRQKNGSNTFGKTIHAGTLRES